MAGLNNKKAAVLLEALPYIKKFYGETLVIKYGGSIMIDPTLKKKFAQDIVLLKYVGINPIIVHGGGKEISKWMARMGKKAAFIDGFRITDSETLEITEMVLSGKINNDLVGTINHFGGKAVGLSGKDANLLIAEKRKPKKNKDLGFVGDIVDVDITLLDTLNEQGYIPVISSIAISKGGETLNMNADHVAEGIGKVLKALKLIFLTDVDGLKIDNKLKRQLYLKEAKSLLSHDDVSGGMLPKLTCAIEALKGGVKQVHIINGSKDHSVLLEVFTDNGIGTMIFPQESKE